MKKENGITLIVLIITIILLLILLGVSTKIVLKSDLFNSAKKAVDGTNAKTQEQQTRVNELMGELEIIEQQNSEHDWQYVNASTREQIRCTCTQCKAFNDGDTAGRTLTVGQQIGETENKTASTILTSAKSGMMSDQTLTLNAEETKWVVFGFDDKNSDGKNETLLLTTEHPTTSQISFFQEAAYNYCIDEINRMCKELYGENARGMTVEDVNKTLGYTPGGMYYLENTYNTTGNLTKKLSDLGNMWTAIIEYNTNNEAGLFFDPSNLSGISDSSILGGYCLDGYYYYLSSDGTYLVNDVDTTDTSHKISTTIKKVVFGSEGNNYNYWLASNGVYAKDNYACFGPGVITNGRVLSYSNMFRSNRQEQVTMETRTIRATYELGSDIPVAGAVLEFTGKY